MIQTPFNIPEHIISRFFVVGINFEKADAGLRSVYALSPDAYFALLQDAHLGGIRSIFAISTCNRTEIYGFVHQPDELSALLVQHTGGNPDHFRSVSYIKNGDDAIDHLFKVAAGLNSQIIGDYEVFGQLKTAVTRAQQFKTVGPIMDRLINFVLQSSKKIKTQTALSSGTVSVSFAAIEWLRKLPDFASKKILVYGIGKFGRNLIKNLGIYLPQNHVTLINRTDSVAQEIANENSIHYSGHKQLADAVNDADVILVCTNAGEYTVLPDFIITQKERHIMDLSVPMNVHPDIARHATTYLMNVDDISKVLNNTLVRRTGEIPAALKIIAESKREFFNWLNQYRHAALLHEARQKLETLSTCQLYMAGAVTLHELHEQHIRKTVSKLALNLKNKQEKGCQFISAYHEFLNYKSA